MTRRASWAEVKKARGSNSAVRAGYDHAALSFRLAEQVRAARVARGMTQQDLAQAMGTTQSVVARLEGGGIAPSIATLQRVADALGVRLMVGFENKTQPGKRENQRASNKSAVRRKNVKVTPRRTGSSARAGKGAR